MNGKFDVKKTRPGKSGSLKAMRRVLEMARGSRSLKTAISKLQVAHREANMIRFGPGHFSEDERTYAFSVSEILFDQFGKWMLSRDVIAKGDVNEVVDGLVVDGLVSHE